MENPTSSFKEGVCAGLEHQSASDNPYQSGAGSGLFNMAADLVTGGLAKLDEQQEQSAKEWEAGRLRGEELLKEKKV